METLIQDLAYAFRAFRKSPLFTATAVLALTLGIGANTAIFSVFNAVILTPVPFPDPGRLVQLVSTESGRLVSSGASPAMYAHWREQSEVIESVTAYRNISLDYTGGDLPERLVASQVTDAYFRTFGAPLASGRFFSPEEDLPGASKTTVVSHEFWTRHLGADPDIIGATLSLSGAPYTVIGIVSPEFDTREFGDIDVWVPFQLDPNPADDGGSNTKVAARLRPGVTLEQAQAQLAASTYRFRERYPNTGLREGISFSAILFRDAVVGTGTGSVFRSAPTSMLWLLLGAVGFLLLIACSNVAGLMLVRASARQREIAVRFALGAGRWRIARQLLTESALLSAAGGAAGLVLGFLAMRALLAINTGGLPRLGEAGTLMGMDWRVIGFTVLVSIATAILFGLLPALVASRTDVSTVIKYSRSRSGTGLRLTGGRSALVIAEIGLALVLLIGAALLIRTTLALYRIDPGFDTKNVVVMHTSLSDARFEASAIEGLATNTLASIRAIPGVEAATLSCCVPLERSWGALFKIIGRDDDGRPFTSGGDVTISTADYFDVFEIPIVRGRVFSERDDSGSPPVVVINRALAERWWPDGADPIGESMLIGAGSSSTQDEPIRQVVGVVENVRKASLEAVRPIMYLPLAQIPETWLRFNLETNPMAWIVRTTIDPMPLSVAIQDEIRRATAVPVTDVRPMTDVVSLSISRQRATMLLMTVFGVVAVLLAAVGIYGLVAYSVQQRTQEIGIRMALGAQRDRIVGMVIRQGIFLAAIGIAIGLAAAFFLADLMASLLFGVESRDMAVFMSVPAILMLVATMAVAIPAVRASRIDPLSALRYE
jgi:putative ABC transport system permease protein